VRASRESKFDGRRGALTLAVGGLFILIVALLCAGVLPVLASAAPNSEFPGAPTPASPTDLNLVGTGTGSITGTVKNATSTKLSGISVAAYPVGSGSEAYATTASDGTYTLSNLDSSTTYKVEFWDDSDTYIYQYYNGKATWAAADPVTVTAGGTTTGIDATMTLPGRISGRISAPGATDLSNIDVAVYEPDGDGGWDLLDDVSAASDGTYDLGGLVSGTMYKVRFYDYSGTYLTQFFNNKSTLDAANAVSVTAGSTTSGIDATLAAAGHVMGTVTNESHVGLGGIYVDAYRSDGSGGWDWVSSASTNSAGIYSLGRLTTGSYRVQFGDWDYGLYASQCWNNKPTLDTADPVSVTAGVATPNINATLTSASAKAITAFSFSGLTPAVTGTITEASHSIALTVPYGTNVGSLVASFTTTGTSVTVAGTPQVSGVTALTFANPVTYHVEAYDGSTQDYVVTVAVAAAPAPTPVVTPAPTPTPTVSLKLGGLKRGSVKLGKSVTATGTVTPTSLAGSKVTLTAQLKKGAKWVKAKTFQAAINSTGVYSWKYKPAKKGAYRMQAVIAASPTSAAATTKWLAFKVK
jgi:hypothetical protein